MWKSCEIFARNVYISLKPNGAVVFNYDVTNGKLVYKHATVLLLLRHERSFGNNYQRK